MNSKIENYENKSKNRFAVLCLRRRLLFSKVFCRVRWFKVGFRSRYLCMNKDRGVLRSFLLLFLIMVSCRVIFVHFIGGLKISGLYFADIMFLKGVFSGNLNMSRLRSIIAGAVGGFATVSNGKETCTGVFLKGLGLGPRRQGGGKVEVISGPRRQGGGKVEVVSGPRR